MENEKKKRNLINRFREKDVFIKITYDFTRREKKNIPQTRGAASE